MNETENALQIIDRIERKIRELHHCISGMVKEAEAYRAEIARLSRINTELESQMRRMVANQCKCDCDWRNEDETA